MATGPKNGRPWLQGIGVFAFVTATIIMFNDNVAECTSVYGRSMEPSISPRYHATGARDYIIWRKWQPTRNLRRGDVVALASPFKPELDTVKRVVALAGDMVVLDERRRPSEGPRRESWDAWGGRVCVPEGHVWIEGDNWRDSQDSNYYGPVSKALIKGKAVGLVWPVGEFGAKPWEGFRGRTKVLKGACWDMVRQEATVWE